MGQTMICSELVSELAARLGLREKDALDYVNHLVKSMGEGLCQGSRIELRGFGAFTVRERLERMGRNPLSGQTVLVPKRYTVLFRAGKKLREDVDASR